MFTAFRSLELSGYCALADSTGAIPVRHEGQGVRTFTHTYTYLFRCGLYAEFVYIPCPPSVYSMGIVYLLSWGFTEPSLYALYTHYLALFVSVGSLMQKLSYEDSVYKVRLTVEIRNNFFVNERINTIFIAPPTFPKKCVGLSAPYIPRLSE